MACPSDWLERSASPPIGSTVGPSTRQRGVSVPQSPNGYGFPDWMPCLMARFERLSDGSSPRIESGSNDESDHEVRRYVMLIVAVLDFEMTAKLSTVTEMS